MVLVVSAFPNVKNTYFHIKQSALFYFFRTTKFANLKEIEQKIYCADKRIVNGTSNKRQIYVGQCLITPQKQNIVRNLLQYIVPKPCFINTMKTSLN